MKNNSFWKFIDNSSTFIAKDPQDISYLYFPLANEAEMMSSITPELKGDIKTNNNSFLMLPTFRPDLPDTNSSRNFWIYLNKTERVWSLAKDNTNNRRDKVILEAGLLYHKIIRKNTRLGLEAEITNFIPSSKDHVELMLIKLTNISGKNTEITATSAIPVFGRSADNLRDHRHVTSLLHRIKQDKYAVVVQPTMSFDERGHKINQTAYFVFGLDSNNQPPLGSFPTQELFVGEGGNLSNPLSVINNLPAKKLSKAELSGKEAIGALRFKTKKLKPKQSVYFALILGIANNQKDISKTFRKFNSINKINAALNVNKIFWKNKINNLSFDTGDYAYDSWLRWVNLQPILRKIYGCSFLPDFDYGRGGKGWRDLWQDYFTPLLINPKGIRPLIISNFSGVRIDGTNATIITKKPGHFISDRNKISRVWMDHGLWPFFTLSLYINQTGDLDILLKKTPYFRDSQILRAKGIDFNWDGSSNLKTSQNKTYKGTILEHVLVEHLVQFFNVGAHNCIRLENADWNDGLDMALDKGESVAFSAFYAYNLYSISVILEKLKQQKKINHVILLKEVLTLTDTPYKPVNYNSCSKKIEVLNKYLNSTKFNVAGKTTKIKIDSLIEDLRRKANWLSKHIYDKEWINLSKDLGLFNGYYDNKSRRLEGKYNGLVKMTLTGQVFPILSGIASNKQIKKIYKAAKKFLQDKKIKGFRLNTDFKKPQFDLGRAFAFAYGEKENGAIFSHMCVMFSYALYRRGFVKEGFEVFDSLYNLARNSKVSKIYPNLPEYFNLQGRGMYSYLTGSASWFVMTLLTQSFGIRGQFGNLVIAPKLVKQNFKKSKQVSVQLNFANKRLNITYLNPGKKDYSKYLIKQVMTKIKFQKISDREFLIKRKLISSFPSKQINIKIILD
ncbi:MAG: cellobiose phosphorylase [Candidatus Omnitrophica bacterium]|nr:cellobiose phosphorylase [Candidatus Omnitrophota bacterium]